MAYKTCENCGSRIFEHGCVNCDEREYISMQLDNKKEQPNKCSHPNKYKVDVRDFCPDGCGYIYNKN